MTAFPPVDDAVLQNNPDFSNLYNKLTNVILNPDGSTKEDPAAKERAAVREVREYASSYDAVIDSNFFGLRN